jgi:hypothetical protein
VKFWDEEKDTKDDKFDVDKELKKIKTPQTKRRSYYYGQSQVACAQARLISHAVKKLFGE